MAGDAARQPAVSVVIPAWNARGLLAETLPRNLAALAADAVDHELLVVDNGSSDGTAAWLAQHYPAVRVMALARNEGFGPACNRGVRAAAARRVLLLNTDMAIAPGSCRALLALLDEPAVFAADSRVVDWETGADCEGARRLVPCGIWLKMARRARTGGPVPTAYATGGGCVLDRDKFLALGGFADIFAPGYGEDYDLSLRAWRNGWRVMHQPAAVTRHMQQATARRLLGEAGRRRLLLRNLWLLHWRHLSLPWLLLHFCCLPALVLAQAVKYGLPAPAAVIAALPLLPRALAQRVAGLPLARVAALIGGAP